MVQTLKLLAGFVLFSSLCITGCGYSLRTSRTPSRLINLGIHRIYVHPVKNSTYRAGVENTVYNSVVKAIGASAGFRAVSSPADADAELFGEVVTLNRTVRGEIKASDLAPKGLGSQQILVATEYQAQLSCSFEMKATVRQNESLQKVWSDSFTRSKPFPANNQISSLGSTSALINESEFDRALADVASLMGQDLSQSIAGDF